MKSSFDSASSTASLSHLGSALKDVERFTQQNEIGTSLHTVLTGLKTTKKHVAKPYVIKWIQPATITKPAPLDIEFFLLPAEYQSTFISTLASLSSLADDKDVNKTVSNLTKRTSYDALIDNLNLSEQAILSPNVRQKIRLQAGLLTYLENFLRTQTHRLSTLQCAELLRRYRNYYRSYLMKKEHYSAHQANHELNSNEQVMTMEATAGALYQFIGGSAFTPKVRVLTHTFENGITIPLGVASKIIDFETALDTPAYILKHIALTNPRQYARLFVSTFVLAETDLHHKNWGINKATDTLVKIDHDLSFFPYNHDGFAKKSSLPNTLYDPKETFNFISSWDILNLPFIQDSKPIHFPTFSHSVKHLSFLKDLRENNDYKNWKYFYFTKALLLSEANIDTIVADHSIGNTQLDLDFKQHVITRLAALKHALLLTPEYRHFLKNDIHKKIYQDALTEEVEEYNLDNCGNTDDGSPKKAKAHRIIKIETLQESIRALTDKSIKIQKKSDKNPLIQVSFQVKELIGRLKKERILLAKIENLSGKNILEANLKHSIIRDLRFLFEINKTSPENIFIVFKIEIEKLISSDANKLYYFITETIKSLTEPAEAIDLFFKYFPDQIIPFIKSTEFEKMSNFKLQLQAIKKHAPQLLADACAAMIETLPGIKRNFYDEIIDSKNKTVFEDFSNRNPEHIVSKIYCAKKAIEKAIYLPKKSAIQSFFSRQPSIKWHALEKCHQLISKNNATFSQDEIIALQKLVDSPATNADIKAALMLLFNRSIEKKEPLFSTEQLKYTLLFWNDSLTLETGYDIVSLPTTTCGCF